MIRDRYQRNMAKKNIWVYLVGGLAALGMALFGVVVILPAASPASGAQGADLLRAVLGPRGWQILKVCRSA